MVSNRVGWCVVALGLLVALAGCSAETGGSTGESAFEAGNDNTVSNVTSFDSGNISGESLSDRHVGRIGDAGSVTVQFTLREHRDSKKFTFTQTRSVDFQSEAQYKDARIRGESGVLRADLVRVRQYETPSERYTNTTSDLVNGSYGDYNGSVGGVWEGANVSDVVFGQTLEGASNVTWTRNGSGQFQGTSVARYESNSPGNVSGFQTNASLSADLAPNSTDTNASRNVTNVTINDANATLLVDGDGVVRLLEYNVNVTRGGDAVTYEMRIVVTEVGSTTISKPDWAAGVKANATEATATPAAG